MMLAMAGFSINDTLIKTLDGSLGNAQMIAVRGTFASAMLVPILWRRGLLGRLREALAPPVAARGVAELVGTLLFFAALPILPFANLYAILQALPLVVTLGAALAFGERVGWRRWTAILVGFVGVLIVVRPGTAGFEAASLLVVLAVVCAATRDLIARALPETLPPTLVSSAAVALGALGGYMICAVRHEWTPMTGTEWRTLALAAVFLLVAHLFIVLAMRGDDVASVVPFRYTNLLWAIGLGYAVFGELPDGLTLLGAAVIVASGLYTLYRETRVHGQPLEPPPVVRR